MDGLGSKEVDLPAATYVMHVFKDRIMDYTRSVVVNTTDYETIYIPNIYETFFENRYNVPVAIGLKIGTSTKIYNFTIGSLNSISVALQTATYTMHVWRNNVVDYSRSLVVNNTGSQTVYIPNFVRTFFENRYDVPVAIGLKIGTTSKIYNYTIGALGSIDVGLQLTTYTMHVWRNNTVDYSRTLIINNTQSQTVFIPNFYRIDFINNNPRTVQVGLRNGNKCYNFTIDSYGTTQYTLPIKTYIMHIFVDGVFNYTVSVILTNTEYQYVLINTVVTAQPDFTATNTLVQLAIRDNKMFAYITTEVDQDGFFLISIYDLHDLIVVSDVFAHWFSSGVAISFQIEILASMSAFRTFEFGSIGLDFEIEVVVENTFYHHHYEITTDKLYELDTYIKNVNKMDIYYQLFDPLLINTKLYLNSEFETTVCRSFYDYDNMFYINKHTLISAPSTSQNLHYLTPTGYFSNATNRAIFSLFTNEIRTDWIFTQKQMKIRLFDTYGFELTDTSKVKITFITRSIYNGTKTNINYTFAERDYITTVVNNTNWANLVTSSFKIYYDNVLKYTSSEYTYFTMPLELNVTNVAYLPQYKENIISLSNQRMDYLPWENYQLKINGTLIYSNVFEWEYQDDVNVSIYSRIGQYLNSTVYTVALINNFISIMIEQFSFKVYNQQEKFLLFNMTYDPNYFSSSYIWKEWIAPDEIVEFMLSENYYKVNVTEYETSSETIYSYHLVDDDILLITSSNTIYNVLSNVQNVNTTLGNQITNVEINLSNQNSNINNTILNIDINLSNVNSTLGNLLIYQLNNLTAMNSSISTLLLSSTNNFNWINSNLTTLYAMNTNSFVFINGTVENSYILLDNSFTYTNATIGTLATLSQNSFSYLNSSIQDSITYMGMNFTYLNSVIGTNQLDILTQFLITQSNVTNNSLNIINNVIAINSSISNLIANLANNVLLVNNSIYTAILNVSTSLALDSNNILGNLSITYQQNDFLTELFKRTMFSELLNWSGVGFNYSLIENQIDGFTFLNNYRNESLELLFRYNSTIQRLLVGAQETLTQYLPNSGTEYRIYSVSQEKYLNDWESMGSSNRTIELGFYDENITPEDLNIEAVGTVDVVVLIILIIVFVAVSLFIFRTLGQRTTKYIKVQRDVPKSLEPIPNNNSSNPLDAFNKNKKKIETSSYNKKKRR
jgi:hypothetical protein